MFLLPVASSPDRIREWVDTKDDWPQLTRSIAYKWLDEGLEDRGITRDLDWGIPVDPDDFPEAAGKVWYVWFDAPIGYLSATREWADAGMGGDDARGGFDRWWHRDRGAGDVTYTQFMGKDNVPFHTLSFPATILGSGEDWKLGRPAQVVQLAHLLRRQVLHLGGPWRVHVGRPRPGCPLTAGAGT